MIEEIIRHELPIQCVKERNHACYAIVPIHLSVRSLPSIVKVDQRMIEGAKQTVAKWYNEDMEYYLDILGDQRKELPHLKGYERFNWAWHLDTIPGRGGFPRLRWIENHTQRSMQYLWFPMVLYNQSDSDGKFLNHATFRANREAEIIYKHIYSPEIVYFNPDKMLQYGGKSRLARFNSEKGIAQVASRCFISNYTQNFAQALLFRAYGVFYHNRLLEFCQGKI
jgi:hypothetical protein